MRDFSKSALADWGGRRDRTLHIFASHEHLDHRNGFPFSSVFFVKNNPFIAHIYGTRKFLTTLDERYGMYSHRMTDIMHVDDPIDYRVLSATFTGSEIRTTPSTGESRAPFDGKVRHVGEPIAIGATTVTPFEVYHGLTQCLGFKVRHKTSTFVFCTDHELRHGTDPNDERQKKSEAAERRVLEQCQDADVVYFDGQYLLSEYRGEQGIGTGPAMSRMDWGHSCIEDIVERARRSRIKRTFIGHHDPERLWGKRVELDQHLHELCKNEPFEIQLARAGATVSIGGEACGEPPASG
jgi:ribonuclease BN (tRNA processing enzyme)